MKKTRSRTGGWSRAQWIRFPFISHIAWAKRYRIEPGSAPCYHCGAELWTSIPFAAGDYRGLAAPVCSCGNEGTPYCVVMADGGDLKL